MSEPVWREVEEHLWFVMPDKNGDWESTCGSCGVNYRSGCLCYKCMGNPLDSRPTDHTDPKPEHLPSCVIFKVRRLEDEADLAALARPQEDETR